jgi:putative DNA-invertase from lambdoid prophage Rac
MPAPRSVGLSRQGDPRDSHSGFVSLTEALDLTTPTGRAMAGMEAVFAQFEREILRERDRKLEAARERRQRAREASRPGG